MQLKVLKYASIRPLMNTFMYKIKLYLIVSAEVLWIWVNDWSDQDESWEGETERHWDVSLKLKLHRYFSRAKNCYMLVGDASPSSPHFVSTPALAYCIFYRTVL